MLRKFRETIMIDPRRILVVLMLVAAASSAVAQDHSGRGGGARTNHQDLSQQGDSPQQNGPGVLSLLPGDAVTEHTADLGTGKLAYTATAGTLSLFNQSGERSAAIFYIAY